MNKSLRAYFFGTLCIVVYVCVVIIVAFFDCELYRARFMRAVGELQFLGFVKATKRKTDHVERLTWGPC